MSRWYTFVRSKRICYFNLVKYKEDPIELSVFVTNKPVINSVSASILSSYLYTSLIFVIGLSFTAVN